MPDLLAHYAASLLVASRVFRFRVAIIVALVGLLPDVDALFMVHRWVTHSFVLALVVGVIVLFVTARFSRFAMTYVAVALSLYMLHIVMDVFTAPTPVFYPLINSSIMVDVSVNGLISYDGVGVIPSISLEHVPLDFTRKYFIEGPIISLHGIILFLTVIAALSCELIIGRIRRVGRLT